MKERGAAERMDGDRGEECVIGCTSSLTAISSSVSKSFRLERGSIATQMHSNIHMKKETVTFQFKI